MAAIMEVHWRSEEKEEVELSKPSQQTDRAMHNLGKTVYLPIRVSMITTHVSSYTMGHLKGSEF